LAAELLAALKSDRTGRPAPRPAPAAPSAPVPKHSELEAPEALAQGHQKRDNKRFTYPMLRVIIGAQTFLTIDWSLGGCMCGEYMGDLKQNQRFKLTMSIDGKNPVYYAAEGRAARVDRKKRTLGIQFTSLSKGGFEFLSGLQLQQRRNAAAPPKAR
jgi:hypothetical protein